VFSAQNNHNSKARTRLCGEEKNKASNEQAKLRKQYILKGGLQKED
jgi:hypothetical protein